MNEKEHFNLDDKIQISNEHHWAKGAIGKIAEYPFDFEDEKWIEKYYRDVQILKEVKRFYWINFNNPQFNEDGEGFYHGAEIESKYLYLLDR